MMKMNKFLLKGSLLLLIILSIFSCEEKIASTEPEIEEIVLNATLFAAEGGQASTRIHLRSTHKWKVELTEEQKKWITVEPALGEGTEDPITVKITAAKNLEEESIRETTFFFVHVDNIEIKEEFEVVQPTFKYLMQDSAIVHIIYTKLGGENWTIPWDPSSPFLEWPFIFVNEFEGNLRVSSIWSNQTTSQDPKQYNIGVVGTFPEEFGQLSALQGISFNGEEGLIGQIPDLSNTLLEQLWITDSGITGVLPASLNVHPNLENINLDNCRLTDIEDGFGEEGMENVLGFQISNNRFEREFNPNWVKNMKGLTIFNIYGNRFSGNLPTGMMSSSPLLLRFEIAYNEFVGVFPEAIKSSAAYISTPDKYICPQWDGFGFTSGTCETPNKPANEEEEE